MAIVRGINFIGERSSRPQTETDCDCYIADIHGEKFVQLNTKGSKVRDVKNATSQTFLLSESALKELQTIVAEFFEE